MIDRLRGDASRDDRLAFGGGRLLSVPVADEASGGAGVPLPLDSPPTEAPPDSAAKDFHAQASEGSPRLSRNLRALVGGQAVTWTMTLIWTLVVPRALGPVGLGTLVSAQAVSGVLAIVLGLGTRNYLVREIVVDRESAPKLVGTALMLRVTLAPIVALAAVLWAHVASYGYQASVVLYLITAMTVLALLADPMQAAFQAIERMKYLAYADIINKSAQSLIGIALVVIGFRTVAIAVDMAAAAALVLLLSTLWLRPFLHIDVRTNARLMGSMLKQSCAYWAFGLFSFFYLWIDTIMLTVMTRSQVVGWYGATTTLFETLMFLPVLVSTAWLPRLVAAFGRGHRNLVETARRPLEFILVISVPVAAGTALVAHFLVHAVYGPSFSRAVPVMVILAGCIPLTYLNIMLAQVLLAAKRQAVWTTVMAGAAVVNPLLNLVLIPATQHGYHNGAIGASISLLVTELVMDVIGFVFVGRHVFDRGGIRRCALAVVASAGMWGVAYATRTLGSPLSLAAGFATLLLLAVVLRILTPDEIAQIRAGLARLRGRRVAESR
jgi:O-antigen/teichoic acid export membrane protein